MRLYIFKSDANTELRAFAADPAGSKLPGNFAPGTQSGSSDLTMLRLIIFHET